MSSTSNEGYGSAAYVAALGYPALPLGATGGHLCVRAIGTTGQSPSGLTDLAGPYPVLSCTDWGALAMAVEGLPQGHVSLVFVTDPACPLPEAALRRLFPVCRHLHDHWLIDLDRPLVPSKHHRKKLRLARPGVTIAAGPAQAGDGAAFAGLYAHLVDRKGIRDARAFSAASLAAQAELPGAHLVTAHLDGVLVGADLYYLAGGRAYAHLSAYAPEGYARAVSYPMMAAAVAYFAGRANVIDLGGAPPGAAGEGMAHFKRGWTGVTAPAFLCGRVLDPVAYARLAPGTDGVADPDGWFPAYRRGEFSRGA